MMSKLDTAMSKIIWLHRELVDLYQQMPDTDVEASSTSKTHMYRPRGIGPKELFIGDDISAYAL